jgi:hypothetical protein
MVWYNTYNTIKTTHGNEDFAGSLYLQNDLNGAVRNQLELTVDLLRYDRGTLYSTLQCLLLFEPHVLRSNMRGSRHDSDEMQTLGVMLLCIADFFCHLLSGRLVLKKIHFRSEV